MAEETVTVAYLGIDVGKSAHSACALDPEGNVAFRSSIGNRAGDIDRLLDRAGSGALVVVDQKRNIGALVLARARAHGNSCAYLPGYAEKRARDMFPGIAKTDPIDAEVIARTAMGMPWTLRAVAEEGGASASLRALSSQREFATASRTRAKNRVRAVLLEADPELEAAVDPSRPWQMALLAEFGGAFGCAEVPSRFFRKFRPAPCRRRHDLGSSLVRPHPLPAATRPGTAACPTRTPRCTSASPLPASGRSARPGRCRRRGPCA